MSNAEPTVVVTEADRRAAWVALRWSAVEPAFSDWFATGQLPGEHWDEQEVTDLVATAQAIAHARTMAAFDERCAAVTMFLESAGDLDAAGAICGVNFRETPIAGHADIRALVLKGWGQ